MQLKRERHINFWYVMLALLAVLWIEDLLSATYAETDVKTTFTDVAGVGELDEVASAVHPLAETPDVAALEKAAE